MFMFPASGTSLQPFSTAATPKPRSELTGPVELTAFLQNLYSLPVEEKETFLPKPELDLMLTYLKNLLVEEEANYADDNRVATMLKGLIADIEKTRDTVWIGSELLPKEDLLKAGENWLQRGKMALQVRKQLGRKCRNLQDPLSLEAVSSIPGPEFLRVRTGYCWNINSLLDYVQETTDGQNDATGIQDYGSDKIWADDTELERILKHEAAQARKFRHWLLVREVGSLASRISKETLDMMYVTAQILVSRGPEWAALVQKTLDPFLYEQFMRYTGGEYYRLDRAPLFLWSGTRRILTEQEMLPYREAAFEKMVVERLRAQGLEGNLRAREEIEHEVRQGKNEDWHRELPSEILPLQTRIKGHIRDQMKRDALNLFWGYYNGLSDDEKNALEEARKSFSALLSACYKGGFCAYHWASVMLSVVYRIGEAKELYYEKISTAEHL
jgi:hypothetical protein